MNQRTQIPPGEPSFAVGAVLFFVVVVLISSIPIIINQMYYPAGVLSGDGAKNEPCRKIEASDPVIVRQEGVGGNDDVELGRFAFYPKAVSTAAGILAVWDGSFDGQRPSPNVYMRLLDDHVNPMSDVRVLTERSLVWWPGNLANLGDKAIFSYCARYNDSGNYVVEDKITSVFLDPYGHPISEHNLASSTDRACNAGARVVWTGPRILFSSFSPSMYDHNQILDITDKKGNGNSWRVIDSKGGPTSPFTIGHDRVFLVAGSKTELAVHRFDRLGNELDEPVILKQADYDMNEKKVVAEFKIPYVIPTTDGWMILASLSTPGIYIVQLDQDGSPVSSPLVMETDKHFLDASFGTFEMIPYRGGAALLGHTRDGYIVFFISDDGVISTRWYPRQDEQPIYGSLFEHRGRLFLIYTSEPKNEKPQTNQVLIRELQCTP